MKRVILTAICFLISSKIVLAQKIPASYEESRLSFRAIVKSVQKKDSSIEYNETPVPSRSDSDLTIGTLYAAPTGIKKNLIVISNGIHGVESSAGSAIEQFLINSCLSTLDRTNSAVFIIHNMNPYGYKYSRRFNENNVDLNRNCFDHQKTFPGSQLENKAYQSLAHVFERTTLIGSSLSLGLKIYGRNISSGALKWDVPGLLSESLAGQYSNPQGIYYGGTETQFECAKIQDDLFTLSQQYENALHLDIHTGLGDYGINQIQTNDDISEDNFKMLKKMFPDTSKKIYDLEKSSGSKGTLVTHGDFNRVLCDRAPHLRNCVAATAEIGGLSATVTLNAIINENTTHQHPELFSSDDVLKSKQALRDAFTINDPKWTSQVLKNNDVMCNAIKTFIEINK